MGENYYKILGVNEDASIEEIKKVYRRKVREYHPDVNPNLNDDNAIKEINLAYEKIMKIKKNGTLEEENYEKTKSQKSRNSYEKDKNQKVCKKESVYKTYNIHNLNFGSIDKDCIFVGDIYVVKQKKIYDFFDSFENQTYLKLKMKGAILLRIGFQKYINLSKIKSYTDIKQLKKNLNDTLKKDNVIILGDFYKPFMGDQIALNVRSYNELKNIERICQKKLVKEHKKFNLI